MATVALDEYLQTLLRKQGRDHNELTLPAGNSDFDLCTIYLENTNLGIHRYLTDVVTLLFLAAGHETLRLEKKELDFGAGNFVLLDKGAAYELLDPSRGALLLKFKFRPSLGLQPLFEQEFAKTDKDAQVCTAWLKRLKQDGFLWVRNIPLMPASRCLLNAVDEYLDGDVFASALIKANLAKAAALSLRSERFGSQVKAAKKEPGHLGAREINRYIDANYMDTSLKTAAQAFGLNANYFSNLVKKRTGKSFIDLVNERKMDEACVLLARTDLSIMQIIHQLGYNGKSFFYKKFKEVYGMSPNEKRDELFRQQKINLK